MITFRWLHKWIGIVIGLSLVLWLVTGIWMVLPRHASQSTDGPPVEWASVSLSPAQVVEQIAGDDPSSVREIRVNQLLNRTVYRVFLKDWSARMIDAVTGEPMVISVSLAEQIARTDFGVPEAPVCSIDRIDSHELRYPAGPLPVMRVAFGDADGTVVYVSIADGRTRGGGRSHRIRAIVSGLHTFYPLRLLVGSSRNEKGLLLLASGIALLGVVTGYWLALPSRWRRGLARPTTG